MKNVELQKALSEYDDDALIHALVVVREGDAHVSAYAPLKTISLIVEDNVVVLHGRGNDDG